MAAKDSIYQNADDRRMIWVVDVVRKLLDQIEKLAHKCVVDMN